MYLSSTKYKRGPISQQYWIMSTVGYVGFQREILKNLKCWQMSNRIWFWGVERQSEPQTEGERSIGSPSPPPSCRWAAMSVTATLPCSSHLLRRRNRPGLRSVLVFSSTLTCRSYSSACSPSSSSSVFGEKQIFAVRKQSFHGSPSILRPFSPVMEWQDCT